MGVLKPRTATVVIYQGDDLAQLGELNLAVRRAEAALKVAEAEARAASQMPLRVGDVSPSTEAEREAVKAAQVAYDAYVDQAADRAVVVTLTSIGRRFRALLLEHPPRTHEVDGKMEVVEDDEVFGVNTETFPQALLTYDQDGRRTVTVDPEVDDLAEFIEDLPDGEFSRLWQPAYWLNRAAGVDPKDTKFSTGFLRSDES